MVYKRKSTATAILPTSKTGWTFTTITAVILLVLAIYIVMIIRRHFPTTTRGRVMFGVALTASAVIVIGLCVLGWYLHVLVLRWWYKWSLQNALDRVTEIISKLGSVTPSDPADLNTLIGRYDTISKNIKSEIDGMNKSLQPRVAFYKFKGREMTILTDLITDLGTYDYKGDTDVGGVIEEATDLTKTLKLKF